MDDTAIEPLMDAHPTVIMVADDYEVIRQLCRTWLEIRGYTVVEAENGEEAVELAQRECPALILMDVSMPLLDGLAATRRIREIKELCDVWIVAISGMGTGHRQAALMAGCDEFLTKPFDFPQLERVLGQLLSSPPRTTR
ncbi:MAG TPA: response regulator [Pyrinomonadaceae bacterium]|jgi:CheY-like chemotaxis protein|nr:response regulator [Pyrinomonadaceae bacterium]